MPAPSITCSGFALPIDAGALMISNDAGGDPVAASAADPLPGGGGGGTGTAFSPPRVTSGGYTFPVEAVLLVFNDDDGDPVAASSANPLPVG